jgi:hypothetical protein
MNHDYQVCAVGEWVETENDGIADLCTCDAQSLDQGHLRDYAGSAAIAKRIALLWNLSAGMSDTDIIGIFCDG